MRPSRQIQNIFEDEGVVRLGVPLGWGPHSDLTYQSSILLPYRFVDKLLGFSSVRALTRLRCTASVCIIVRVV